MSEESSDYLKSLNIPKVKDSLELLNEGRQIGENISAGTNKFLREHGVKNEMEYRKKMTAEGKMIWRAILGLPTVEMQKDALEQLYDFSQKTGARIDIVNQIPNILSGIPEKSRDHTLEFTSYALEYLEQYITLSEAVPIQPCFPDFHLISPNAIDTTVNSIKVGANYVGVFSQIVWDYPNYRNEEEHLENVVRALGIMASKKDDMFIVDTYLDDGIPGYFLDYASYIGYALLEKHIVTDLCGARYVASFGQLWSDSKVKMGALLALSDLLKTDDQPGVGYTYGNSLEHWREYITGNYGLTASEILMQILVERKYKTGAAVQTIPVSEQIAVPTVEAMEGILGVCNRLEERAQEWDSLMDFTAIEKYRDQFKDVGVKFFNNILAGFKESGIDIENPLEMLWVLRKVNAIKLEKMFHPSVAETGAFSPCLPSSIVKQCMDLKDEIINDLKNDGFDNCLEGKKVIVVSADAHWYGAFVVEDVLAALGASVVNGGVSVDAIDLLDMADEEGIDNLCISVHNGQALDYAKLLQDLSRERHTNYNLLMGGKLNAVLEGETEPCDVTEILNRLGIFASEDLKDTVKKLIS